MSTGTAIFAGFASFFSFCETVYLLYNIYLYVSRSKKQKNQQRISQFQHFALSITGILILENLGIALFVFGNALLKQISYEVFHLRCILMVFIFLQLRDITFGQERTNSIKKKATVEKNPTAAVEQNPTATVKKKEYTQTVELAK
jgi:cytochrome c biogenesis protein CcdA